MFRKDNPREVRWCDAVYVNKNHTRDTRIEKILKCIQETSHWLLLGNGPRSQGWELLSLYFSVSGWVVFYHDCIVFILKNLVRETSCLWLVMRKVN